MFKKTIIQIIIICLVTFNLLIACKEKNKENKIILFGDSLMSGYGLDKEHHLSTILEKNLTKAGYKVKIINQSVSGDTSSEGLNRINQTLAEENINIIVLCLGANDMLRKINPSKTEKNLEKIINLIHDKEIKIIMAGMISPITNGFSYKKKFDPIYKNLSNKYKLSFIPFLLEGIALKPEFNLEDGMHPNAKGIKIISKNIEKKIIRMIN